METVGWNPLLDERSHATMFPGFGGTSSSSTTTLTTSRPMKMDMHRPRNLHPSTVKFSLSEFDELDSLLPLPSPAISISPGVFFEDGFNAERIRSPSLGFGSSMANNVDNDDLTDWRPSSVAQFFFPKNGSELPYDMVRARSAVPSSHHNNFNHQQTYLRPDSSAGDYIQDQIDCRDDSPIDDDSSAHSNEHWTDWNIKMAPGCPPLDQLFENKRRWREKFNQSVPPPLQRHCVFCKSISKPPQVYLSHAIRDVNGEITCPVLKIYRCPKCGIRGHTVRYCALNQKASTNGGNSSSGPTATNSSRSSSSPVPPQSSCHSSIQDISVIGRSTRSSMGFY